MAAPDAALQERLVRPEEPVSPLGCRPGQPCEPERGPFGREALRRLVTSVPWAVVVFAAAMTDILLLLVAWSRSPDESVKSSLAFFGHDASSTLAILGIYVSDVAMKAYVFTLPVYLRKCGNALDATITLLSVAMAALESRAAAANAVAAMRYPRLVRLFFRLVRLGHCCRGSRWAKVACEAAAAGCRRITGMHKRRFVDPANDFDLDLVYVRPRLIGMSVPAAGLWRGVYRNPLSEVARFFETFHPHGYTVVNCCPELPYPEGPFARGEVVRFDIQDHTPPKICQVVEFLNLASSKMQRDPRHVLAVHCKGGKGRTGSLCGALLLYTKEASDDKDACEVFARARTDQFSSHHRQTVDTASQRRYLEHVHTLLSRHGCYYPARVAEPPCVALRPLRLSLQRWFAKPVAGSLVVAVHAESAGASAVACWSCEFQHDEQGSAAVELAGASGGAELRGDVRISVFAQAPLARARSRSPDGRAFPGDGPGRKAEARAPGQRRRIVAGKEPGCLFYFMFHTTFVPGEGRLEVPLIDMDKAGKGKHRRLYRPEAVAALEYAVSG